ncbi:MAG: aminoglycoside phosphotransferase family protein [Verrucomicrobiota bacterium]|nr:aminoglycoside phosphotransferase family protein [Verrucomicrobiota bacterium]
MSSQEIHLDKAREIARRFRVEGDITYAAPYGSGHINDTYAVTLERSNGQARYVFQRINHAIFRDVEGLMRNIARVTAHIRGKLEGVSGGDLSRATLSLVPTRDGGTFLRTGAGECWRAYEFIAGASTYDVCVGPDQACEAARAFGRFQSLLVDLPGGQLVETLPYFHHTPRRFDALLKAIEEDKAGRRSQVEREIAFCMERRRDAVVIVDLIEKRLVPKRITHNDTKLNNVMIDDRTGKGLCVIDLDTVMPGSVLYDFGDMVRTFTPTATEDETDLDKVTLNMAIFEGLVQGYLDAAGKFLTPTERQYLVFSGKLITFTIGVRFLADYLAGDLYFKIARPDHNLDRARTQFKMVREIEERGQEMERITRLRTR